MQNARILVVISEVSAPDKLLSVVLSAISGAARPMSLAFAVPKALSGALDECFSGESPILKDGDVIYTDGDMGLSGVSKALAGDGFFLSVKGAYEFSGGWNRALTARLGRSSRALLTGVMYLAPGCSRAQAYLPGLSPAFDERGVLLSRGLALKQCPRPVRTMLIWPGLLFGPYRFLRGLRAPESAISFEAHAEGYEVLALETPLMWPAEPEPDRWLCPPQSDSPRVNVARFEKLAGFSYAEKTVSERARRGLFTSEDGYAQSATPALLLRQKLRGLGGRRAARCPMLVCALMPLPDALTDMAHYTIGFSFLKSIRKLPLTLYAGGPGERAMRMSFPNTLSYPDNAVLPRTLIKEGMTPSQHFGRSKLMLLERTMRKYPEFTHFAWADCDALPHPVLKEAEPDFSHIMDDKVHIGMLGDAPDPSFIIAPGKHIRLLSRESQALSQVDAALGRSFSEIAMLKRLMEKFADIFAPHAVTLRSALFWTGFEYELLSEECALAAKQIKEQNV